MDQKTRHAKAMRLIAMAKELLAADGHKHQWIPDPDNEAFRCECGEDETAVMCDECGAMFPLPEGELSDDGEHATCGGCLELLAAEKASGE